MPTRVFSFIAIAIAVGQLVACGSSSTAPATPSANPGTQTSSPPSDEHEPVASSGSPSGSTEIPGPHVLTPEQTFAGLTPPPPAWLTCAADTDCAVVEIGCCDHCNGGRLVAVKSSEAAAAMRQYHPASCVEEPCTERGCARGEPVCVSGRCGVRALWFRGAAEPPSPGAAGS